MPKYRIYLRPEGLISGIPTHTRMTAVIVAKDRETAADPANNKALVTKIAAELKNIDSEIQGGMQVYCVEAASSKPLALYFIDLGDFAKPKKTSTE